MRQIVAALVERANSAKAAPTFSKWKAPKSRGPLSATRIGHTAPFIYSVGETLDVSEDRPTPILEDYANRTPFKYNGRIDEVEIHRAGGNAALDVPDIDGK
jgi:hypothetical protein